MHAHLFIMDALALKPRPADPARGFTISELSFDFQFALVGTCWSFFLEPNAGEKETE